MDKKARFNACRKYNEFDEPRDVEIDQIYALKEGYQIDKSRTEIAVEYACHYEGFYMSLIEIKT